MAATVKGTFVIIDRASSAMRRMEKQAQKTDRAIEQLGRRLDSAFSRNSAQNIDQNSRSLRNWDRETRIVTRNTRHLDRATGDLSTSLAKLGGAVRGVGALFNVLKLPAIISAFGGLVQITGALTAGVTALLPRLGQMGGLLASGATAYASLGIAAGTAALALKDVGAGFSGSEAAMKRLTPQAKAFVKELKAIAPAFKTIKTSAQEGLFPGLSRALQHGKRAIPTVRRAVGSVAEGLGNQADRAVESFTNSRTLHQFSLMAEESKRVTAGFSTVLINLGHALLNVMIAARPLTNWLVGQISGWAKWTNGASRAALETGKLGRFFQKTKVAVKDATDILMDWWGILRSVAHAAEPLGESIWSSWVRGAQRLRELVESERGQRGLRGWFNSMKRPLREVWGLTKALGKALAWLSQGNEGSSMLRSFRALVWPLAKIVKSVTAAFGPTLADTLTHLSNMIESIVLAMGEWGRLLNIVVRAFDWLFDHIPGLTQAVGALVALFTFNKIVGGIRQVIGGLGMQLKLTQANTVAQMELNAARAGGVSPVIAGRGGARASTVAGEFGEVTAVNQALGLSGLPGLTSKAGALGALKGGLRMAGKAFLPLSALFGVTDFLSTPGGIGNKLKGTLSGATFGLSSLVPGLGVDTAPEKTPGESRMHGNRQAMRWLEGNLIRQHALTKRILNLKHNINQTDGLEADRLKGQLRTLQKQQSAAKRLAEIKAGTLVTGGGGFRKAFMYGIHHGLSPAEAAAQIGGGVSNRIKNLRSGNFKEQQEATILAERFVKALTPALKKQGVGVGGVKREVERALGAKIVGGHAVGADQGGDNWKDVRQLATSPLFNVQAAAGGGSTIRRVRAMLQTRFSDRRSNQIIESLMGGSLTLPGAIGATRPTPRRYSTGRLPYSHLLPTLGPMPAGPEKRTAISSLIPRLLGTKNIARDIKLDNLFKVPDLKKEAESASEPIRNFNKKTVSAFEDTERKSSKAMQETNAKVSTAAGRMSKNASESAAKMATNVSRANEAVLAETNSLVRQLGGDTTVGVKKGGNKHAGKGGNPFATPSLGKGAKGMRIPGKPKGDSTPVFSTGGQLMGIADGGELIVNRHTEARINGLLGGRTTLGREVANEKTPHFAKGGRAGGTPTAWNGVGPEGLQSGIKKVASALMGRFPLQVTSTTGGTHATGSFHYSGQAVDIGGPTDMMYAASEWLKKSGLYRQLAEGIHNPNLSVSDGRMVDPSYYSEVWAGHADHIHLAVSHAIGKLLGLGGGGGMGVGKTPKLKNRFLKGSGLLADEGNAALARTNKAAQGRVNKAFAKARGQRAGVQMEFVPGGGNAVEQTIARVLFAHGLNKIGAAGIIGNAYAESTLNPAATGYGGGGLWGFTSSPYSLADLQAYASKRGKSWTSAALQTQFLLKFIGSLIPRLNASSSPEAAAALFMTDFEKPGIPRQDVRESAARRAFANGYETGGRIPWYGSGGDFVAHRPQVIGVGDGGPERVTITPRGRGSAAGGGIKIGSIHVENHRDGDIRKQIEREVGQALRNVTQHLKNQGAENANELMD